MARKIYDFPQSSRRRFLYLEIIFFWAGNEFERRAFRKLYIPYNGQFVMEQKNLSNRLDRIEKTLKFIQENMIDIDVIITEEERRMLDESVENEKSGNLVSLEEIKNVRNKVR
jgi:hypothetical protein